MENSNPSHDPTFREHLEQVYYWQFRFELSGEICHYDNAERHAEVIREYLPKYLNELSIIGLSNLHLSLYPLSLENSGRDK